MKMFVHGLHKQHRVYPSGADSRLITSADPPKRHNTVNGKTIVSARVINYSGAGVMLPRELGISSFHFLSFLQLAAAEIAEAWRTIVGDVSFK